jgi:uncharacterized protein with PIN domain
MHGLDSVIEEHPTMPGMSFTHHNYCPKCKAHWQLALKREDDFHGPIYGLVRTVEDRPGFEARVLKAICPNCGAEVAPMTQEEALAKVHWPEGSPMP